MKKLALPLVVVSMLFVAPAFADETSPTQVPAQGTEGIALNEHDALCREAMTLQERRIRDLRAAIEWDKKTEKELLEHARIRDDEAKSKDEHAKRWRAVAEHADPRRKAAFNTFAGWLEAEARTDRDFARERRNAAAIIAKGWGQAAQAISNHERQLAELKSACGPS